MENIRDMQCGKMSAELSPQTKEKIFGASSKRSAKSKANRFQFLDMRNGTQLEKSWEIISPSLGEPLTHSFGEFPSAAVESFLSQILEVQVPEKYYLSPKACRGILRRAALRGKELPEVLKKALERQAQSA